MKLPPFPLPEICEYAISTNGITCPLLLDFPHGGRIYPSDFGFACPDDKLELCEEKYLDDMLLPTVLSMGGVVIKANFPRTYVDTNRSSDDIDPLLFEIPWPKPTSETGRSVHGHGVIMRLLKVDEPIYARPLTHSEVEERLKNYYVPYHALLGYYYEELLKKFGKVIHLNIHSVPSAVVAHSFPHISPDFILGDRDGRSCGLDIRQNIAELLKEKGYRIAINQLYKGAEIVSRYGQPAWGRHSLQIEINRGLFQNDITGEKLKQFDSLQSDLDWVLKQINALQ